MATTAQNNLVKAPGALKKLSYPVDAADAIPFNAGDLVYYDSVAKFLKPLASGAQTNFVGVAEDSSSMSPYGTKIVKAQTGVIIGAIHSFKTTAAEVFDHQTAIYCGADAQTVSTTANAGPIIGYVQLRPGQTAVTGAAGVNVDVMIIPNYPTTGLA